jgi:transcription elongation factor Elf1
MKRRTNWMRAVVRWICPHCRHTTTTVMASWNKPRNAAFSCKGCGAKVEKTEAKVTR